MSRKQYFFIILILGSLATVSPFSIDMYLPGFPRIASDLGTTIDKVQLSLTSYLIGICIGQVLYGPLLDRFGRKKTIVCRADPLCDRVVWLCFDVVCGCADRDAVFPGDGWLRRAGGIAGAGK
jgi:MFS family permease